jgi:hypothetical protein
MIPTPTAADASIDSQTLHDIAGTYQDMGLIQALAELSSTPDWDRVTVPVETNDDNCVTAPADSSLTAAFSQWLSPGVTIHALFYNDLDDVVFVAPDEAGFCTACDENDAVELHEDLDPLEALELRDESNCIHAEHAKYTGTVEQCNRCGSWEYSEKFAPPSDASPGGPNTFVGDLHVRYCPDCGTEHEWF